jgi:hypothetical protein
LQTQDTVKIRGAVTLVSGAYSYDEVEGFEVLSTPSATSFTYELPSDPGMNAAGSPIFFETTDPVKTGSVSNPQDLDAEFDTGGAAHGFQAGALVSVFGVTVGGSIINPYNGVFKIQSVPDATKFTYKLQSTPLGSPGGNPSCASAVATPLVADGTTATFRTIFPHGFVLGHDVTGS